MKYIKLFENFADEDNKFPFSITVKPTEAFKRSLNEMKNADGKPSFLGSDITRGDSEITLKRNGDRFNLVKVATTPFDLSKNEYNGKSFVGKQDDYWLSYDPKNKEIYVHTSRIFGTSTNCFTFPNSLNNFNSDKELLSTDRRYATEDYKDEGLIWIGGYYCKFEKGFEVGMKDHRGYFEITKVEI
jgi:hypothetical protein